jgi:hypothetical protein
MKFNISNKNTKVLLAVIGISLSLPLASFAGFFGDHPRYLHALSDLREARALLERPDAANVMADESAAIRELDASISEIKKAAMDDWKPVIDAPHIDVHLNHKGRLTESMKVLERAHKDIAKEEDDRAARGLQQHALAHLDKAMMYVQQAIGDKRMDQGF